MLVWGTVVAAQVSYYVNGATGSDLNPGVSPLLPWKTIQKACNSALPNSVVYIAGGTYYETVQVNVTGLPGAPIVFTNYQDGQVIIDGEDADEDEMLKIINKGYLTFENLIIQNLRANDAKGIEVSSQGAGFCTNLTFRNLTIRNIRWTNNAGSVPSNGNNAHGMTVTGKLGGISQVLIDGCKIYNNILGRSEAIQIDGNVDGFTIINCEVHDNTNIGIVATGNYGSCPVPSLDRPRNGLIASNICYRNISNYAQSAGIYVDGGHDIVVERNVCYQNSVGIEVGCEEDGTTQYVKVINNMIYNNRRSGLFIGGYTTQTTGQVLYCTIRNNTFFQNNSTFSTDGELTMAKTSHCVFEDNIFYSNNSNKLLIVYNINPQQNNLINYNLWCTPSGDPDDVVFDWRSEVYESFSEYESESGMDGNSIFANPMFQDATAPHTGLALMEGSAGIDSGNPELSIPTSETDFLGSPRIANGTVDMGAIEYSSLGTPATSALPGVVVYPNPFSGSTVFYLPQDFSNGHLKIYDIAGREVCNYNISAGTRMVDGLQPGIYLYCIISRNGQKTSGKIVSR